MSVHGEYSRYLSDLIDALEVRDDVAGDFLSALRHAALAHAGTLSKAAENALDALARADAPDLGSDDDATRELASGLAAIARVVLGRPAPG